MVGASPSACSYHLRTLSKYGFVEEVHHGRGGRARPWMAAATGFTWERGDPAGGPLRDLVFERALDTVMEGFARDADESETWRGETILSQSSFQVTVEELQELRQSIRAVVSDYHRRDGRAGRPGVRRFQLLVAGALEPEP